ncbi:MAG: hypothetical protein U5K79_10840 [Cyclobacteriaceae bacterium]|nr:hypothetical protein [Cyclobacteriaceae bacterium]
MKPLRHWIFTFLLSFTILFSSIAPSLALVATEKTEVELQKADTTIVKSEESIKIEKEPGTVKKIERTSEKSSYNFIFYLVTMILKALSYYPQR